MKSRIKGLIIVIIVIISGYTCNNKFEKDEKLFGVFTIGEKLNIFAVDTSTIVNIVKGGPYPQDIFNLSKGSLAINYALSSDKHIEIYPKIDTDSVLLELVTIVESNKINLKGNMSARNPMENIDFYIKALTEKYGKYITINKDYHQEKNECKIKFFNKDDVDLAISRIMMNMIDNYGDDNEKTVDNIVYKCDYNKESTETIYQWENNKMYIGFGFRKYKPEDTVRCKPYFFGNIVYQIKDEYLKEVYNRNKKKEIEKAKEGI